MTNYRPNCGLNTFIKTINCYTLAPVLEILSLYTYDPLHCVMCSIVTEF